jgi:hypothetical protein
MVAVCPQPLPLLLLKNIPRPFEPAKAGEKSNNDVFLVKNCNQYDLIRLRPSHKETLNFPHFRITYLPIQIDIGLNNLSPLQILQQSSHKISTSFQGNFGLSDHILLHKKVFHSYFLGFLDDRFHTQHPFTSRCHHRK